MINYKHINFIIGYYSRVGNVSILKVFGITVYSRIGDIKRILFFNIKKEAYND